MTIEVDLSYNKDMKKKNPYPIRRKTEDDFKVCTHCKANKPPTDFTKKDRGTSITFINLSSWCKECTRFKISTMRTDRRLRVLSHYSNGTLSCALCGYSVVQALDIDHIHGLEGKRKDREDSRDLIKRLIEEKFPEGYRILCRNCNWLAWFDRRDSNGKEDNHS